MNAPIDAERLANDAAAAPPARPPLEQVERLAARGLTFVFYPSGQKGPSGAEAKGWTTRKYELDDYREGMNVGVMLGTEIATGKFLADVDLDWTEGLVLARKILPPTGFGFGRASRKISHAFYTTSQPVRSRKFEFGGTTFVELRGTKDDGTIGLQTMVPPSIHPSGEAVVLRIDEDIPHDDRVERRVELHACGCLLFVRLGPKGFKHDVKLAVAGLLLEAGVDEADAKLLMVALAEVMGNTVAKAVQCLQSTAATLRAGKPVTGATKLAELLGGDGRQVVDKLREWLRLEDFTRNKNKAIASTPANIRLALSRLGAEPYFDAFMRRTRVRWRGVDTVFDDAVLDNLWFGVEKRFGFQPEVTLFSRTVKYIAREHECHPVLDYLASVQWDGQPRVDTWLVTYGGAEDTPLNRAIGRLFLTAAVRRVRKPGCKFDELPVLEGRQGNLKSSAIRELCPEVAWFSDDLPLDVDSKEVIERTSGKWIIEAAELSGMRANQREHLKAMLSRQIDGPARMSYAREPIEEPRQFVLIGTTNDASYLNDSTGNRRFWPVRVDRFDLDALRRDRNQLWAEAAALEAEGVSIRLDPSLWEAASAEQEQRREADPWEASIAEFVIDGNPDDPPDYVIAEDIWTAVLFVPTERRDKLKSGRVSQIMQTLGYATKKKLPRGVADPSRSDYRPIAFWRNGVAPGRMRSLPLLAKGDDA